MSMVKKKNNRIVRVRMGYLALVFFLFAFALYMGGTATLVGVGGRMKTLGKHITQIEADLAIKENNFYHTRQILISEEGALEKIPVAYVSLEKETRFAFAQRGAKIIRD